MYIELEKQVKGFTGKCWIIHRFMNIKIDEGTAEIVLWLYKDKASFDEDVNNVIHAERRTVDIADVDGNLRYQAYQYLLANPPQAFKTETDFQEATLIQE